MTGWVAVVMVVDGLRRHAPLVCSPGQTVKSGNPSDNMGKAWLEQVKTLLGTSCVLRRLGTGQLRPA